MSNDNAIDLLKTTTFIADPITGMLHQGARKLLARASVFIINAVLQLTERQRCRAGVDCYKNLNEFYILKSQRCLTPKRHG